MGKPFESRTCSGTLENANGRKLEVKRRKKERVRDIVDFMVYDNVFSFDSIYFYKGFSRFTH